MRWVVVVVESKHTSMRLLLCLRHLNAIVLVAIVGLYHYSMMIGGNRFVVAVSCPWANRRVVVQVLLVGVLVAIVPERMFVRHLEFVVLRP